MQRLVHAGFIGALAVALAGCSNKDAQTIPPAFGPVPGQSTVGAPDTGDATERADDAARPGESPAALHTVYFEFDSAALSDATRAKLVEVARWLEQNPGRTLTIAGHTDELGTEEYNLALGEARAQAVYSYLLTLGVSSDRLRTISYGEAIPAEPAVLARNRRSEFIPGRAERASR